MTPDTALDLPALHDAITARLAAAFPGMATVEPYREDRDSLPLPAILYAVTDMEPVPEEDRGTGQVPVLVRMEAVLVLGFATPDAQIEARTGAAAIARAVHHQRWGQPIGPALLVAIEPETFKPELDQHVAWRVEWMHAADLGESVWGGPASVPTTILLGTAPRIGPAHEDDYVPVGEPPQTP